MELSAVIPRSSNWKDFFTRSSALSMRVSALANLIKETNEAHAREPSPNADGIRVKYTVKVEEQQTAVYQLRREVAEYEKDYIDFQSVQNGHLTTLLFCVRLGEKIIRGYNSISLSSLWGKYGRYGLERRWDELENNYRLALGRFESVSSSEETQEERIRSEPVIGVLHNLLIKILMVKEKVTVLSELKEQFPPVQYKICEEYYAGKIACYRSAFAAQSSEIARVDQVFSEEILKRKSTPDSPVRQRYLGLSCYLTELKQNISDRLTEAQQIIAVPELVDEGSMERWRSAKKDQDRSLDVACLKTVWDHLKGVIRLREKLRILIKRTEFFRGGVKFPERYTVSKEKLACERAHVQGVVITKQDELSLLESGLRTTSISRDAILNGMKSIEKGLEEQANWYVTKTWSFW